MKALRIVAAILIFTIIAGYSVLSNSPSIQMLGVISASIVGALISVAYEMIDTHGQGFGTWLKSKILYRNKDIYLSFSYLYKIEVEGKYLLIKGHRMPNRYQPIGGVYKFYPEARSFLNKIKYVPDTMVGNNDETDDLRISIKAKYLLDFYDWFLKMENREYDPTREFYEELISPGLLPEEKFRHLHYRKVHVHNVGITKSVVPGRKPEVIYADIFEVTLNDEQKRLVKNAVNGSSSSLCLASPDEMASLHLNSSVEINLGNNTPWLIEE